MKNYHKILFFGLFLNFIGCLMVFVYSFAIILGWVIFIAGKVLILASVLEYVDYRRAFVGEDLSKDHKIKKKLRRIRKKYLR